MSFLEESRPIILAAGGTGGHIYPAISLARALIKKPDLVILDDCLSAVDTKTEQAIFFVSSKDLLI